MRTGRREIICYFASHHRLCYSGNGDGGIAGGSPGVFRPGGPTPNTGVGAMLSESRQYIQLAPHVAGFPGLAIFILVLGFNLFGDGLRDILDPSLR